VILHALERDHTITWRLDHFPENLEAVRFAQAMFA
jgi:hypothetical protein